MNMQGREDGTYQRWFFILSLCLLTLTKLQIITSCVPEVFSALVRVAVGRYIFLSILSAELADNLKIRLPAMD